MNDPRRESFIESLLDRTVARRAGADVLLGLAFQLAVLLFLSLAPVSDEGRGTLMTTAAVAAALDVVALLAVRARRIRLATAIYGTAGIITTVGMLTACVVMRLAKVDAAHLVGLQSFSLIVVPVSTVLSFFRGKMIAVVVAFNLVALLPSYFVPFDRGFVDSWLVVLPIVIVLSGFYRRALTLAERKTAAVEYERLRSVAPPAIIDSVVASPTGRIDEAFRPTDRTCVCICSDWRNYQAMTAGMSPLQVVQALEHYYTAVDTLLERCFPRGNFFSDWIADELFVVAFALAPGEDAQLAREAVAFASALVAERPKLAAATAVPKAIDVGVAMGTASVGLMGPPRHRKATALGEVPGTSRRLQSAAKLLRERYGDKDRVVVDRSIASLL